MLRALACIRDARGCSRVGRGCGWRTPVASGPRVAGRLRTPCRGDRSRAGAADRSWHRRSRVAAPRLRTLAREASECLCWHRMNFTLEGCPSATRSAWRTMAQHGEHRAAYDALGPDGLRAEMAHAEAKRLALLADVARFSGHPSQERWSRSSESLPAIRGVRRRLLAAVVLGRLEKWIAWAIRRARGPHWSERCSSGSRPRCKTTSVGAWLDSQRRRAVRPMRPFREGAGHSGVARCGIMGFAGGGAAGGFSDATWRDGRVGHGRVRSRPGCQKPRWRGCCG